MVGTTARRRFSWVRAILCLFFVGTIVAVSLYENAAHRILGKANDLQMRQKYRTAFVAYQLIIERYPFSFAVPQARAGLSAISPAVDPETRVMRLRETLLERAVSNRLDPHQVDHLLVVGWPLAAAISALVFVTRIRRRPGWGILALLMAGIASFGVAILLAMNGLTEFTWTADVVGALEPILVQPLRAYAATWVLLGLTAGLTLSPIRSRVSASNVVVATSADP